MEALVVSSKPWIDACWWKGEYKHYHSVWEPPIMCVAWKISPSLGCYVDNESIPLKILFISISKLSSGTSTNPYFPLRRAYLFTFMLSHHPLIKEHQLESTTIICTQNIIHLCFKTELWHLYKSLLPSTKGLSIYFYVESSPSY